jgi:hypothetical protein
MTTSDTASTAASLTGSASGERADILETLRTHRFFLRHTVEGLTDEQARLSPTASELTLGGLIKHVSSTEAGWADFAERGTEAMPSIDGEPSPEVIEKFQNEFRLPPDETLADALAGYEKVAARTDAPVESLDLDTAYGAPTAPWFAPGATRPVRRVFLHIVDRPARRARRHHPGDDRRPEDDGLSRR